jgi:hypothetical protein
MGAPGADQDQVGGRACSSGGRTFITADTPHFASAILNHAELRVTEEHHDRASSISASRICAEINGYLRG